MLGDSTKFNACEGWWEVRPEEFSEVRKQEALSVRPGKAMESHGSFLTRGEAASELCFSHVNLAEMK